jgi:HK97 family phage major capsid protein
MALGSIVRGDAAALIPEEVSAEIIKEMPNASVILGNPLVRRKTMSRKQLRMPIVALMATAFWVDPTDNGVIGQSKSTWANKFINAEKLAVIVPIEKDVLADQDYDLWGEVKPQVVSAVGAKFDAAVLFGDDAPDTFPECISDGCDRTDHEVKAGTGVDFADDVNDAMAKVEADGIEVNGHIARNLVKSKLRGLRATTHELILSSTASITGEAPTSEIWGEPAIYSKNGAWEPTEADLFTGDWSNIFVGLRQDFEWSVLTEATVGGVNLAETDQVGLKVTFRAGWQIGNPPTQENPDNTTRYPFAAVRPTGWVGSQGGIS